MFELWITKNNGVTWEAWGAESSHDDALSQKWDLENSVGISGVQIRRNGVNIEW